MHYSKKMGKWIYSIDQYILNLSTRWRWPHYPQGKSPRYPLDRRLGGSQNQSGQRGEEKNLALTGTSTPISQPLSP
jgi:hypothetical protein